MTLDPIAGGAAKRSLVQRIERFLDYADAGNSSLTAWETEMLCRVMALLQTGYYEIGEETMRKVERPDLSWAPEERARLANGPILTVAEMRANLERAKGQ